jgi:HlyD family secretion protein
MKRVLPILVLAAVAAAGVLWWRSRGVTDADRIVLSGNIELREYLISFKTAGRLVELAADEGDDVQEGQLLARLDPEQLTQSRDREQASLRMASAQLVQMQTGVEYARASSEGEIALRRAEVAQAEAQLREMEAGSRPQDIRAAKAAVEDLHAQAKNASADWERAQRLYQNEDITTQQFDQFRTRWESLSAALRQAEQRLAVVEEGPRREQIDAARAAVDRARAALKLAEASRLGIRQREQELETRRAEIDRARYNVAVFDTQLSDLRVMSPVSGVVLVKSAEMGEVVAPGTSILTIGEIERPWLRGYIPMTQLGRVKVGQKTLIRSESFPNKTYEGRVSFIASEAEFTPKQIQTHEERVKLVYRIKIDVANPERELKLNMPVDAEILTGNQ